MRVEVGKLACVGVDGAGAFEVGEGFVVSVGNGKGDELKSGLEAIGIEKGFEGDGVRKRTEVAIFEGKHEELVRLGGYRVKGIISNVTNVAQ